MTDDDYDDDDVGNDDDDDGDNDGDDGDGCGGGSDDRSSVYSAGHGSLAGYPKPPPPPSDADWVALTAPDGRRYFYNDVRSVTSLELPSTAWSQWSSRMMAKEYGGGDSEDDDCY